jgi:hypothetical protein
MEKLEDIAVAKPDRAQSKLDWKQIPHKQRLTCFFPL